ncbi:MAG: putative outer membrane protein [Cypionkella sp.]|nr:putative outer membrane protein [Cypionkella sp.]
MALAFAAEAGAGGVSQKHAALLAQLEAAPAGREFDMMYVDSQIAGHQELRAIHAAYAKKAAIRWRAVRPSLAFRQ